MTQYRFSINSRKVKPIYGNDVRKDISMESGERYFRADLIGTITFVSPDYDWIMSQPFTTEFVVLIEKSSDTGLTWSEYFTGKFYRSDCAIDEDYKKIDVKLDTKDKYVELLAGMEKEFDLVKLLTPKTPVVIQKRPLLQVYILGGSQVSCFLGGNSWVQDTAIEVTSETDIVNLYHFALSTTLNRFQVTGDSNISGVQGDYIKEGTPGTMQGPNNIFRMEWVPYAGGGGTLIDYYLKRNSDDVILYQAEGIDSTFESVTLEPAPGSTAIGNLDLYVFSPMKVYMRYLLDVESIGGNPTHPILYDDLVAYNRNYKRVIGYSTDLITFYNYTSTNPTEFGITDSGTYFLSPTALGVKYYPVLQNIWGYSSSVWFNFDLFDSVLEEEGRKDYILKDAILLVDVLKALLKEIDPTIQHEATSEYSQFFYGSGSIAFNPYKVLITPKSNITAGEYDRPAKKGVITLAGVLEMLKNCFKNYFYLDGNKFKLEHIAWYKRGGTYTGTPALNADLTLLKNPNNRKPWAFDTNKYEYEKSEMAERFEFKWMDEVTDGFKGFPIEILSKFVQRGKIETVSVSVFSSDVDYMLLSPEEISKDGFAVLGAYYDNVAKIHKLAYLEQTIDGGNLTLQNGLLSWLYLHPTYWTYDLPANNVKINNLTYTSVNGVERRKKQKVNYPSTEDPNPFKLIKTYLGNGEIEKISINLQSRSNEIDLRYDTEQ